MSYHHHTITVTTCAAVQQYLNKSGVQRMCVGHKPVGDSPLIIRSDTFEACVYTAIASHMPDCLVLL